jgi:hypothetical protein
MSRNSVVTNNAKFVPTNDFIKKRRAADRIVIIETSQKRHILKKPMNLRQELKLLPGFPHVFSEFNP